MLKHLVIRISRDDIAMAIAVAIAVGIADPSSAVTSGDGTNLGGWGIIDNDMNIVGRLSNRGSFDRSCPGRPFVALVALILLLLEEFLHV